MIMCCSVQKKTQLVNSKVKVRFTVHLTRHHALEVDGEEMKLNEPGRQKLAIIPLRSMQVYTFTYPRL